MVTLTKTNNNKLGFFQDLMAQNICIEYLFMIVKYMEIVKKTYPVN